MMGIHYTSKHAGYGLGAYCSCCSDMTPACADPEVMAMLFGQTA